MLRTNYRNTRQIIETAMACTGDQAVNDLGDEYARGDAEREALAAMAAGPVLVLADDFGASIDFVSGADSALESGGRTRFGRRGRVCPLESSCEVGDDRTQDSRSRFAGPGEVSRVAATTWSRWERFIEPRDSKVQGRGSLFARHVGRPLFHHHG